jgi:xylulokinase
VVGAPDGKYELEGQTNAAGSAFKWFRQEFCDVEGLTAKYLGAETYDYLTAAAMKSAPGARGVFFLPYLSGAYTPHYDEKARGTFVGMTFAHTRNDLLRSVMEGVCYDIKDLLTAMVTSGVPDFTLLRLTGGISRSDFWCQMQADIYNRPCETVECEEATSLGSAIVAAVGVGIYKDFSEAAENMVQVKKHYEPDAAVVEQYADAYEAWKGLFDGLHGPAFDNVTAYQNKYF